MLSSAKTWDEIQPLMLRCRPLWGVFGLFLVVVGVGFLCPAFGEFGLRA